MKTKLTKELADFIQSKVSKEKIIEWNLIENVIFCSFITKEVNPKCILNCEDCSNIFNRTNHNCNIFKCELEEIIKEYNPNLLEKISIKPSYRFIKGDLNKLIDLKIEVK